MLFFEFDGFGFESLLVSWKLVLALLSYTCCNLPLNEVHLGSCRGRLLGAQLGCQVAQLLLGCLVIHLLKFRLGFPACIVGRFNL